MIFKEKLFLASDLVGNGPGFCVPFYLFFFIMNKAIITKTKLIFFESWCRVQSFSLTAKIVRLLCDRFLVHWKEQADKDKKAEYHGKLI